ncbi:DUF4270 domain-containing protein [Prevotella falsenii]|uniref:DUF4270 domain-containing protein n=1 Tax=Prevotella falsenii TaxID=515414 RepID=UPI0004699EF6|nr:DUF4270 domain-containing protein [Prevotella falsenii]
MKAKLLAFGFALMAFALTSCDDTTGGIGGSLTDETDKLKVQADTFNVGSHSILANRILSYSAKGYLGQIKDPETQSEVTANLMSQLYVLPNFEMPKKDIVESKDASGNIIADSCELRLYYSSHFGDSLAPIKITTYELDHPVKEGKKYLTDFDPEAEGYLRTTANNGLEVVSTYTLTEFTVPDSVKKDKNHTPSIRIKLNEPYTDKAGKTYNNYGTYMMDKYYENPNDFRNLYKFLNNICPGFYFKVTDGLGSMAAIEAVQLVIYYQYKDTKDKDKVKTGATHFTSTEEVLQLTNFKSDQEQLKALINTLDASYLKTPAGLFTEVELPVSEIMKGHENDTLNTAKFELQRITNKKASQYNMDIPTNVLILPTDSAVTFFEKNKLIDNKTSYIAAYNAQSNSYKFNNVAGIINYFIRNRATAGSNPNWGKVLVIPVEVKTTKDGQDNVVINKISYDMRLTSTMLLGGDKSKGNIKMSVIYSKFHGR